VTLPGFRQSLIEKVCDILATVGMGRHLEGQISCPEPNQLLLQHCQVPPGWGILAGIEQRQTDNACHQESELCLGGVAKSLSILGMWAIRR
jgi:hypothetical protein